jgi:hypothetical protein
LFPEEEDFAGWLLKLMLLSTSPDLILPIFIIISELRVMMVLGTTKDWLSAIFYFFSEFMGFSMTLSSFLFGFYLFTDSSTLTTS